MGLKHWILPYNYFMSHLSFSNFWLEGPLLKAISQTQKMNLCNVFGATMVILSIKLYNLRFPWL